MALGGGTARSDLRGGVGWIVFGLAIVGASLRMDRYESMGGTLYTAPGLVPGMLGLLLMLLGALLAWRGGRRRAAPAPAPAVPVPAAAAAAGPSSEAEASGAPASDAEAGGVPAPLLGRRTLLALALALSYAIVLIGRAPFAPSTALFVAVFSSLYSEQPSLTRRLLVAVAAGMLTAAAVVLIFERVFLVRLP